MEKDYVPKHKPVEKNAHMKQQSAPAHTQQKEHKPAVQNVQNKNTHNQKTETQASTADTKPVVQNKEAHSKTSDTTSSSPSKDAQAPASTTSHQAHTPDTKGEQKSASTSDTSSKKEEPKKVPAKVSKKDFAMARVIGLAGSKKYCMYICEFIKYKTIDQALKELNEVLLFKRAIPMRGEIPHRSEPGMMSGRYPIKVTAQFITMLKGLRGNALVNGMDIHKTIITMGSASWGSRPAKRGGMRFKRTNVTLQVGEKK